MTDIDIATFRKNLSAEFLQQLPENGVTITRYGRSLAAVVPIPSIPVEQRDAVAEVAPAPAVAVDALGWVAPTEQAARILAPAVIEERHDWDTDRAANLAKTQAAQKARDQILRGSRKEKG